MQQDRLTRFLIGSGEVRGQIVRLEFSWQEIVARHPQTPGLNCLGELSAAANLLAASLKFDGDLILQIHGHGPIKLMVVECRPQGLFRATLKSKTQQKPAGGDDTDASTSAKFSDLVNQDDKGRFIVTLEPSKGSVGLQPYQAIVPLEGETVAGTLENYMARSEQVPSRMFLAANEHCAVGLLLQKMPAEGGTQAAELDVDTWPRVTTLAQTLSTEELLQDTPDTLLRKLFWQEDLRMLEQREVRFSCTCSREKVGAMLKMLGRDEVESILTEQGEITTQCDFCNTVYRFDAVDAAAAFIEGVMPAAQSSA
jgi:molecular chaperone Hsp33